MPETMTAFGTDENMSDDTQTVTPLETADDVSLIRRFVGQGDREAMGALLTRHADLAYRTALRIMRNPSEAEDAVQIAFAKISRGAGQFRGQGSARAWMMKIVAGTCADIIREAARRRAREQRAFEGSPQATGEDGSEAEMTATVKQALEALPDRYRLPIWMHHGEGMSFDEIAEVLSLPEGTLRSQVSRGLEMLRENLGRAGVSVQAAALVGILPSLSAESAPAGLAGGISEIVRGIGHFAQASTASKAALAGGGMSAAKAAGIVGVLVASAAAVGTAVYVAGPEPKTAAQTQPASVPAGAILFQDSFENGLGNWQPVKGRWSIAKGKGVGGSDCLQVEQFESEYPLIWSTCDPGCTNFEVNFKIFLPTGENVWLGLMFGPKEWPSKGGYSHSLWESIGGAENMGWKQGKWREYRCVVKNGRFERVSSIAGRVIKEEQFTAFWAPLRRPGLQIAWFGLGKGPFVYVDDFVVKKLPGGDVND
jgi:RNA polymerase sigma-70 factor (ECF subfamily)